MLLSAAEKDSGVLPGPPPSRVHIDPYAFNRNRKNHHWRNFQLGLYSPTPPPFPFAPPKNPAYVAPWMKAWAPGGGSFTRLSGLGDIEPVDITPQVIDPGSFPAQDYSSWLQPVTITPQVTDPYYSGGSAQAVTWPDYLQPVAITPAMTDPTAGFITPTAPDIQPPSFTISDQPAANPVPIASTPGTSGSTDYFGDFLKLASVAGQTFVGYTAAEHGYVPGVTGGIGPGAAIGGRITPAQYAMMTPAQRAQYAAMYPGSIPGSSTDLLSQLFGSSGSGGSSLLTWVMIGGAALTLVLVLKK